MPMLLIVLAFVSGCTLAYGARVSGGPSVDSEGNLGAEVGVHGFWGMSDDNGRPGHSEAVLLETVRVGFGSGRVGEWVSGSVAFEYLRLPVLLGLGVGFRGPTNDQDQSVGELISVETSNAYLWEVGSGERSLASAGVELHCAYRFGAAHGLCSLGPSLVAFTYRRVVLPH